MYCRKTGAVSEATSSYVCMIITIVLLHLLCTCVVGSSCMAYLTGFEDNYPRFSLVLVIPLFDDIIKSP